MTKALTTCETVRVSLSSVPDGLSHYSPCPYSAIYSAEISLSAVQDFDPLHPLNSCHSESMGDAFQLGS